MTFAWKMAEGNTAVSVITSAVIGVLLCGAGGAKAQNPFKTLPNKPVRLMVGGYFPAYRGARDALGQNFISFGASLDIAPKTRTTQFIYSAYFDYFDRVKYNQNGRNEAVVGGGGILARYRLVPQPIGLDPYVGAGVGIYNARLKQNTSGNNVTKTKTSLGGKFLVGAELPTHIFGEVEYDFVPRPERNGSRNKLNGYQARIGYRF